MTNDREGGFAPHKFNRGIRVRKERASRGVIQHSAIDGMPPRSGYFLADKRNKLGTAFSAEVELEGVALASSHELPAQR